MTLYIIKDGGTGETDKFIGNGATTEVHHKNFAKADCQIDEIADPVEFGSLADARRDGFDLCAKCFASKK
jgi:hypothetical protein